VPPELGSPVFFGFLLFAGAATALAMVYAFKKMNNWRAALTKDAPAPASWTAGPVVTEWLSAFPASAVFILLAASFWLQRPLQPNPGMVTLACFLALSIFLARRLSAPIMGIVVL
jgi:chromate transport protein ChrA